MKIRQLSSFVRNILSFIIFLVFWFLLVYSITVFLVDESIRTEKRSLLEFENEWYKSPDYYETIKQHKKHGILISIEDSSGWWFERDGKKCYIKKK